MKLLLYCTKAKPQLFNTDKGFVITDFGLGEYYKNKKLLNGKIVAECDFEVETGIKPSEELNKKSCMTNQEIIEYLLIRSCNTCYAIHIKNLHIFEHPKWLEGFLTMERHTLRKAPQNMCKVLRVGINDTNTYFEPYILVSIRPKWLCKILNGEKTIEIRRRVLKEMLK